MPDSPDVGFQFGVEGDQSLLAVIQKLREEMKTLKASQDELGSSALDLSKAWRQLGALAATLKLAEFAKDAFDSVVQIGRLSAATGVSTQTLSVFRKATEDAGLSQDQADQAVKRLSRSLLQLEQGNRRAAQTFALLHDVAGKPLTAASFQGLTDDQKLLKVVDALGRLKGGLEATGVSAQLLGRNSGEMLAVMQRLAGSGFKEVQESAQSLGLIVTPQMVEAFLRAKESMANLEGAARGVAQQFETGLLPELSKAADGIIGVATSSDQTQSSFQQLGEYAGKTAKVIIAAFVEIGIWAKAIGLTIFETIGGALQEIGNVLTTAVGAGMQAAKGDFVGAWQALKAGGVDAAQTVSEVWNNAKQRIDAALDSEAKLLEGINGQVKHAPLPKGGRTITPVDATAGRGEFSLDRARLADERAAAQEELALLRATAAQREAADKDALERGLITLHEYFERRRQAIAEERDKEIAALSQEKSGLEAVLTKEEKIKVAPGDAQGEIKKQVELLGIKREIAKVDNEIAIARIKAQTATSATDRQETAGELSQKEKSAQSGFQTGISNLDATKQNLQGQVAAGELLPYQAERQYQEAIRAEIPILQAKVALLREAAKTANPQDAQKITEEAAKDEAAIAKLQTELTRGDGTWMQWRTSAEQSIDQISSHITSGFNGWIQGHESFGRAAMQTWNSIVMTAVTSIEKIGAKWIAQHLIMAAMHTLFKTQQAAEDTAGQTEQLATTEAANVSEAASDAAVAAAGALAYYSAFAPEIAPELAAAQYAIGMGFAGAAGMAAGGLVAKSMYGGGQIYGPGSSTSDSVPIWASNGEFMMKASSTRAIGSNTLSLLNENPGLWESATRGASLPPIRQSAPYTAAGMRRAIAGADDVSGGAGPTFSHSTHISGLQALDGASVRAALEEHGDLVGKIAVAHVQRFFRNGGVNR